MPERARRFQDQTVFAASPANAVMAPPMKKRSTNSYHFVLFRPAVSTLIFTRYLKKPYHKPKAQANQIPSPSVVADRTCIRRRIISRLMMAA